MEQLELDFNRRDARDHVRIGPAAFQRLPAVRRLRPGARVLVVDSDGNRCEGVLRYEEDRPGGHQFSVELDWDTWIDGDNEPLAAAG